MTRSSSSLNSWPTSSSASMHVRRDDVRLGAHGEAHRLAVGVDDGRHVELAQLLDEVGVDDRVDAARQRAGEDDDVGAAREVEQLVAEQLDLLGAHRRAALVDLRRLAVRRVEDGRVRARLLADADEVVEDRLGGELLDDPRARRAAREAGGDDRLAERLERAGDVDALAARHRRLLDGAMPASEPEVRHGQRLVDRRVEGDGDDHATSVPPVGRRLRWSRRRRSSTSWRLPSASTATASTSSVRPMTPSRRCSSEASSIARRGDERDAVDRPPAPADLDRAHARALGQRAVELRGRAEHARA